MANLCNLVTGYFQYLYVYQIWDNILRMHIIVIQYLRIYNSILYLYDSLILMTHIQFTSINKMP